MSNIIYTKTGKAVLGEGTYLGLLKDLENMKKNGNWKVDSNKQHVETYTSNYDNSHKNFAGGTWEDVTNMKNMDKFQKQLGEFKKNNLEEKIIAKLDYSPRRKRTMSEHDGDYDHDKRWEIKAFSNSKKDMLPIKVVDVNVDMSISCAMKAEEINRYGALVWSIIQMVETLGIQANINIINEVTNLGNGVDSAKLILEIKKAGQYISPVALATCFQSVFFRRVIFAGMVMECETFGNEAYSSLGTPKYPRTDKHIWFEKGVIYTRAGGKFDAKEVEEAILKMIGR